MFPPLTLETVRWRPLKGEGLEHPAVRAVDHGLRAESTVTGENEAPPYGARNHLDLGAAWPVRSFAVEEPAGRRTADDGTDTDLVGSTSTTTLPNRRPCLATGDNSPLSADLPVDAEGFVSDYPTRFARL